MKKITTILSIILCIALLFCFVGCSAKSDSDDTKNPTTQNNVSNPDNTKPSTSPNDNKPLNDKDDKEDKKDTEEKIPSKLSQEADGFYFTFDGNKIKLPMKYSEFMEKMNAIAVDTIPEKIFSHESKIVKIKVVDTDATIVVMGNDFNNEILFNDADVISLEMDFIDEITLKKDIKNNFVKTRVIARYGEADFGNASQYDEYFYYSLPFDSYDDHNFGLELTFSGKVDKDGKTEQNKTIEYFKYGSLHIEYVEY